MALKHPRQRCREEGGWCRGNDEGIHVLHLALHWTTEFVRFMTCWLSSSGLCRENIDMIPRILHVLSTVPPHDPPLNWAQNSKGR